MAYQVEVSDAAELDADIILNWLVAVQAGEAGLHWFHDLESAIASLADMPHRCPLAPENKQPPFEGIEVRQLLYGRRPNIYRILFTITDSKVIILHIRHGRRQYLTS